MVAAINYVSKDRIKQLSKRSDLWGAWLVTHVWGVIIAAIAGFILWPNAVSFIAAFLIIGSRQHGLAVLMHEAAHGILFKNRTLNDLAGQYLLAAPYGADMYSYRRYHLKHHRYAQSENDPDLPLSVKYPLSRASMTRKLLRDMFGLTYIRLRLAALNANKGRGKPDGIEAFEKSSMWPTLIANVIIFGGFLAIGHPWLFLGLWLLPLVTWFFVIIRIRNIAEHAVTTRDDNPLTHARTTRAGWLARIFLAPYWVNYHIEHHAYMYVPCYRFKALHLDLGKAGYHNDMDIKDNYLSVLNIAITG